MSYQTFILLPPDSGASLPRAHEALHQSGALGGPNLTLKTDHVAIDSAGWRLCIRLVSGAHIVEESRDIALRYGSKREDRDDLARRDTRFELDGDTDTDMEHFNDYLLAVERLAESFGWVAFECHTEEFV